MNTISNISKSNLETSKPVLFYLMQCYPTIKFSGRKDTAPGPDGIPYSVYSKLWYHAGPLILKAGNIVMKKNELSREQQLSTIYMSKHTYTR